MSYVPPSGASIISAPTDTYVSPDEGEINFVVAAEDSSYGDYDIQQNFQIIAFANCTEVAIGEYTMRLPYMLSGEGLLVDGDGWYDIPAATIASDAVFNDYYNPPNIQMVGYTGATCGGGSGGDGTGGDTPDGYLIPNISISSTMLNVYSAGDFRMKNPTFAVEMEIPVVGYGIYKTNFLRLAGFTGAEGEVVLDAMTIEGTGNFPVSCVGDYNLRLPTIVAGLIRQPFGSGDFTSEALRISGTGIFIPASSASYLLKVLSFAGSADFSPDGDREGTYVMPVLKISGLSITTSDAYVMQHRRFGL